MRRKMIWFIFIFFVGIALVAPNAYKNHWYFIASVIGTMLIVGFFSF